MDSKAFDEFGKLFIKQVRDPSIETWDYPLKTGELMPKWEKFESIFQSLTEEQKTIFHEMGLYLVDGVLHDLLFMLETSDWIKVHLETEGEIVEDIRRAAKGDLQGYIFIWAEKYSAKYPDSI
jgi:hypothetical protein